MHAVYVLLFLGAFFCFAFTAIFTLGSLIHLVGVGREALRAASSTRDATAEASPAMATAQVGHSPRAVPAEIGLRGDVACAAA
jgi:hypothetical protein